MHKTVLYNVKHRAVSQLQFTAARSRTRFVWR